MSLQTTKAQRQLAMLVIIIKSGVCHNSIIAMKPY